MKNVMDTLRERGFIKQVVYEKELYELLGRESVRFYIGFDPTADSLHVGHFLALMAMSHMQKHGHKPIILIGGGTAKIGDPSGRTDMRQMMANETIKHNCECFKKQMSKFLDFTGENAAIMVNNDDCLSGLNYIEFIRDIGSLFSVNKMLTCECFKTRMEKGLSFLEFNYMLMQSYDFLELFEKYGCKLQCGGDDQWSNILSGADLIRRKKQEDAFAMTFQILTTSEGKKMGKTQKGAVWLDSSKTSPYEFFQYWRNVDDSDVEKCLKLLTFVSLEEINELCAFKDERINAAKERLAYEVTKIVHGKEEADKALSEVKAAFGGDVENMPSVKICGDSLKLVDIMVEIKFAPSKAEAKRLILGGGIRINNEKISSIDEVVPKVNGTVIHKGKKGHVKLEF